MACRLRCVVLRIGSSATRKKNVRIIREIVHVDPGWRAHRRANKPREGLVESSVVRSDVRSADRSEPCTGSRTSATSTVKAALTVLTHKTLSCGCESRSVS
jgi:hypothetical protein